ncbi:hypothetical protein QD712_25515 [Streptomyces acidiscabies]|uniref:hypothetical protein n=1 Tax=Streptomyces acidiscabies TaxID=42234 RepID=UPI0030D4D29C
MSAPLVVNTRDGVCWTRRGALRGGEALYAPEGVPCSREALMLTESEVAERGIVGQADALPMPVAPGAPGPSADLRGEVDRLRRERDAYCDRVDALTSVARGNKRHVISLTDECRQLAAEVAELKVVQRHTDEALDDAVRELRAGGGVFVPRTERQRWVAIADALNAAHEAGMPVGIDLDGTLTDHEAWSVVWDRAAGRWTVAGYDDEPDGITRSIAPTQVFQAEGGAETGGAP